MFFYFQVLNVSHNQFKALQPNSLREFEKLQIFDISSNNLSYLFDGSLDFFINLQQLYLSQNEITEIELNVFLPIKSLKILNLADNKISNDDFLIHLTNLNHLDISFNQFQQLNLSHFIDLQNAKLYGNPWSCSWLIAEMSEFSSIVQFGHNYTVETEDRLLTMPGIDCNDNGINRSVVVLLKPMDKYGKNMAIKVKKCLLKLNI